MANERIEALWRLLILIVSGIILDIWGWLVAVLMLVNWVIALITNTRNKEIAEFCNIWIANAYEFVRYVTFNTNKRPFPFSAIAKEKDKYEK